MIDDWLPQYEFEECHTVDIAAAQADIGTALRAVTVRDVPVARALWSLRVLPARLRGKRAPSPVNGSLVDQLVSLGGVLLEDRPGLLVAGLGGRFWQLSGNLERFAAPEAFRAYTADGSCKAVVDFAWEDGQLATTTRVHVPDSAARRSFGRYWLVVRPFSGAIRRALLGAVKRRAEAAAEH